MTTQAIAGSRGRPSHMSLLDLRDDLTAERNEGVAFAKLVGVVVGDIHTAIRIGNESRVLERAGHLNAAATRFARQRGGVL